jgi:hypothetical protein
MDKNEEFAIQTQQKFEFYLLGLAFTVLGLSVQTSLVRGATQGRSFVDDSGQLLQPADVQQRIEGAEQRMAERSETMLRIERHHKVKYVAHKWLFVAGLLLLTVSRAIGLLSPATGMAK